jgi:hypothetical protein
MNVMFLGYTIAQSTIYNCVRGHALRLLRDEIPGRYFFEEMGFGNLTLQLFQQTNM